MKNCLTSILIALAAFWLTGCRAPPSAGITVESYPGNSVTVNSRLLGGWIKVQEVIAAKNNDLLHVQVTAQNTKSKDCQFEYRFEWLDKNGLTISTPLTTWIPVSISAMEKNFMKGVAPTKNAEDFVFVVRFRRPSMRWTR